MLSQIALSLIGEARAALVQAEKEIRRSSVMARESLSSAWQAVVSASKNTEILHEGETVYLFMEYDRLQRKLSGSSEPSLASD
jgi:hypothetical protein